MPIYAYKCASCGHAKDVLQKLSDDPLIVCPACGAAAFSKQVTAAGFQLKGSGWYATDFKNGSAAPASAAGEKSDKGEKGDTTAKPADGATKPGDSGSQPAKPAESAPATTTKTDAPSAAAGCGGPCACH